MSPNRKPTAPFKKGQWAKLFTDDFKKWLKEKNSSFKNRSKNKNIPHDITVDYLQDLWDTQCGKCYYSGIDLFVSENGICSNTPSIDRKIPHLGYVCGNIVWCSHHVNSFKRDLSEAEFNCLINNIVWKNYNPAPLNVIVNKIHDNAQIPTKGSDEAACFDVYSVEEKLVQIGSVSVVKTGIQMKIPAGYMIHIVPRSGLAFHQGIAVLGGIIDSDYRGEIMVMLTAIKPSTVLKIKSGDRVAQLQVLPVPNVVMVDGLVDKDTDRGSSGFGSTGS